MAAKAELNWTFPQQSAFFLRIERYYISILAIFIFIYFYYGTAQFLMGLLYTVLFFGIYVLTSYIVSMMREPSEQYTVTKTHLHVHRKTKKTSKKHKIALKEISHHKVDHFFRGGYVVLKDGSKHVLFFNNEGESKMFIAWVQKHSRPAVKKKAKARKSSSKRVTKKNTTKRKTSKKRSR